MPSRVQLDLLLAQQHITSHASLFEALARLKDELKHRRAPIKYKALPPAERFKPTSGKLTSSVV